MSIKSTQTISRAHALGTLLVEIPKLGNDDLATLMDALADMEACNGVSMFDNFFVVDESELRREPR